MSILIKGFPLPNNCGACPLRLAWCRERIYMVTRPERCPLVPVPEHGRLIDTGAFAAEMKKRQEEAGKWLREAEDRETAIRADAVLSFLCEVKLTLDAAPTIIPAEEGEA